MYSISPVVGSKVSAIERRCHVKHRVVDDEAVRDCSQDPCLNGATCLNEVDNFFCLCAKSFHGPTCQKGENFYFISFSLSFVFLLLI